MAGQRGVAPEDLESLPTSSLLAELRRRHEVLGAPPTRLALLGPPCAGKRTQAEALRRALGVCRITGDDLQRISAAAAAEGGGAQLTADERAVAAVESMLARPQCRRGFVLEGFPQTVAQAARLKEVLDKRGAPLEHAVFLEAPEDQLHERCSGRLRHEASGRQYHERFRPPAEAGIDDYTGEKLSRPCYDATEVGKRLQEYASSSSLLRTFFDRERLTRPIGVAGTASAEEVTTGILAAVRGAAVAASASASAA
eukprot:TRINITY_DN14152_c1_g6_i1.p2 TRINITY_DN14152_c1_g6~~TRINITY_DN14152_c1_g6_i1.p2  ORF type:complete len:268 (+),score=69.59 TRINITY_DN14152_c1_g6_i1:40-804(+)